MSAEELLSRTVTQLPPPAAGVSSGDADRVERTAEQLEDIAATLRSMAPDLGIKGKSADAGTDAFREVMREMFRRADEATAAAAVARRAYTALVEAKHAYQGLPPGEIDSTQRSFYLHGGMAINPGGMALTGPAAVGYLDQQAARSREYQAQQILNQLNADMTKATKALPEITEPHFPDGTVVPPSPGISGGGTRSYTPGGVGATGVGGVPSGSGAVLDQPTWSPSTGAGAGAQNPVTGSGVTSPGTIGGGSSTPGGSTPGSGSADGLVGGTVPGATGPGTIGAGTGTGTGVGGAGVFAGGTAIGGAALGAAGLGRTGLGGTGLGAGGAGRIGGIGGMNAGGMGGAGGLGGAGAGGAGAPGAGVRGSTGIGATPGASPTGTGTGAAAGGRGMTGMPMGGGGAGAGSTKNKRTGTANYLVPDLGIDEDPTTTPLGPGARAGSRDQQPPPITDNTLDDPDDDTW